jgi:hypothetical protein
MDEIDIHSESAADQKPTAPELVEVKARSKMPKLVVARAGQLDEE